ncbi:heavy-metal-associated domain-containing protein [Siminovitchia fortis]|uniref:heavy-metal-associated domain-containing protein n=1 Tax=Siminovitchia fortis TaxID=254758 RepID=UPI00119F75AC|nr:heavy metal-associated domain-containing protein [Siminovitchia fortis]
MKTVKFQMEALTCPSCIKKIEGALKKQKGVQEAKVLFYSSKVKVIYNEAVVSADKLQGIITKLGYPILSKKVA